MRVVATAPNRQQAARCGVPVPRDLLHPELVLPGRVHHSRIRRKCQCAQMLRLVVVPLQCVTVGQMQHKIGDESFLKCCLLGWCCAICTRTINRGNVYVCGQFPPHVVCAAFTHSRVLSTCSPQPQEAGRRRQPGGGSDHHLVLPVLRHLPGGPRPRPVGAHPVLQPRWLLRPAEARSRPVEVSALASAQGPCVGAGLVLRPCRHRTGSWRVGSAACLGMVLLTRGHSHFV